MKKFLVLSLLPLSISSAFAGNGCSSSDPCTIEIINNSDNYTAVAERRVADIVNNMPMRWNEYNNYQIPSDGGGGTLSISPVSEVTSSEQCESTGLPLVFHYNMQNARGRTEGTCTLTSVMHCIGGYVNSASDGISGNINYVYGMVAEGAAVSCTGPFTVVSVLKDQINPEEMGFQGSGMTGWQQEKFVIRDSRR